MREGGGVRIVVITGMSGAGKSSALHLFEDMGYYCMDNIPPQLIRNFIDLTKRADHPISQVALGVDIRGGEFFDRLQSTVEALRADDTLSITLLFLTSTDEALIRRYKEKRRPHPMDKAGNIYDGIQREKQLLDGLRRASDYVIDTSTLSLGQLKEKIDQMFLPEGESPKLLISLISFGFKHGILLDADLIFDVRFINNPFYVPELKNRTGLDPELQEYVTGFPETGEFLSRVTSLLEFLEPFYLREGKRTLTVGMGCTGGRHRSVAMAELLGERLRQAAYPVAVSHRDRPLWN